LIDRAAIQDPIKRCINQANAPIKISRQVRYDPVTTKPQQIPLPGKSLDAV
jgi:hypothetical protein